MGVEVLIPKDFAYYPSRITEARLARGMIRSTVSEKMEITSGKLADVEHGFGCFSPMQMLEFAKITDLPLAFFQKPPQPITPGSIGQTFFCTPSEDLDSEG